MNMNKLAEAVALLEGKKREVNIAQIKEIIKIMLMILAALPAVEAKEIIKRYRYKLAESGGDYSKIFHLLG